MNILGWIAVDPSTGEGRYSESGFIYSKRPAVDDGIWRSPEGGRLLGHLLSGEHRLKPGQCKRVKLTIFEDGVDDKERSPETVSKTTISDGDKRRIEDVFAILKDIMEG